MAKEFGKIIIPTDGSDEAKIAAKKALFLAKHIQSEVLALFVVDTSYHNRFSIPENVISYDLDASIKKEGMIALREIEKMGKKMGVKITRKMVDGIPDDEIIKVARKNDLIVMGSKGLTGLDRILIGSVSEKVLHHAQCPVMIVREVKRKTKS